jgi:S-(hydroxymethyl)glutathione dehydrogenase/alcohol dehydrogenase
MDIEELTIDEPGPGEVLIRTAATGVCHSDMNYLEGVYPMGTPVVLGHEAAGVVEAVGDGVAGLHPGDHVITCVSAFCGQCRECISGNPARCTAKPRNREPDAPPRFKNADEPIATLGGLGTFAEKMLVNQSGLARIDPQMPLDRAALIGCAVLTGLGAVFNTAAVRPGQTVAVFGCGGIGLNCIQAARMAGASHVFAVDRVPAKLDLALRFGATHAIDASAGDPVEHIIALSDNGVDHAFEAIGLKLTAEQAFAAARPGGTATIIGMIPPDETVEIPAQGLLSEKRLQGSLMGSNRFRIDMPRYVELYLEQRLELDALIAERISLSELDHAFDRLRTGEAARSVIVFPGG